MTDTLLSPRPRAAMPAPTVLDIEASGFGADSYPIEVGFVRPDGSSWCSLIRPEPGWLHWDGQAESLHGIERATAVRHGRSASDVAGHLNAQLRGSTVYCDGWAHDYAWLARLFDAAGRTPSFRLEHLRRLLDEDQAARWHGLVGQVTAEAGLRRHRASGDARLLQIAWQRLYAAPPAAA